MATLDDLKIQRTAVQREFSKCVNRIERGFDSLSDDVMANEQVKLTSLHEALWSITDDYLAVMEDIPLKDRDSDHSAVVDAVTEKADSCKKRYDEVMLKLKDTLWTCTVANKYSKVKQRLEADLDEAKSLGQDITQAQYDTVRDVLTSGVAELGGVVDRWAYSVPKGNGAEMREALEDIDREVKKVMRALKGHVRDIMRGSPLAVRRGQLGPPAPAFNLAPITPHPPAIGLPSLTAPAVNVAPSGGAAAASPQVQQAPTVNVAPPGNGGSSGGAPAASPQVQQVPAPPQQGDGGSIQQGAPGFAAAAVAAAMPRLSIGPMALPKFSGDRRGYFRWREEWVRLQRMADPSGSPDLLLYHLRDSISDAVTNELRLGYCYTAQDVFCLLDDRYGDVSRVTEDIVMELQELPAVHLIQEVERAVLDLTALRCAGAINNPLVVRTLESKLPHYLLDRWLAHSCDPVNGVTALNRFERLLAFLCSQKTILVRREQLQTKRPVPARTGGPVPPPSRSMGNNPQERRAYTRASVSGEKSYSPQGSCVVCGEEGHPGLLYRCKSFRKASVAEKREHAKKTRACFRCLDPKHDGACKKDFLCRKEECKKGEASPDHHYMLCLNKAPLPGDTKSSVKESSAKGSVAKVEQKRNTRGPTEQQEAALAAAKLTQEQLDIIRKAFTNKATTVCADGVRSNDGPVLFMLLDVTTKRGDWVGALIDLASDTNYVTHQAAERLGLSGEPVTLVVHGVGGMTTKVETKRYSVGLKVGTKRGTWSNHDMFCYGLDEIARVGYTVDSERLERFFPGDVQSGDLRRPDKVEMLISAREGRLAPRQMRRHGDLVLWDGPLGKTVSGAHPELSEVVERATLTQTHFAQTMRAGAIIDEVPQKRPRTL